MKTNTLKKILTGAAVIFCLLTVVLVVHIYTVTRPKTAGVHTKAMARIDIRQDIDQHDATMITAWMYKQKGVDHVLCNAANNNVVFTYFPVKNSAGQIAKNLGRSFHVAASRYLPTEKEMQSGCPVSATTSYHLINHLKKFF